MTHGPLVRVRDVMKPDFDIVDGMATIADALKAMRHVETKTLIVRKRHENDEWGILMVSDIARKVLAQDRAPDRVNVYEVMTKPALTVHPEMDIRYCARLFARFSITRAPVVEGREIIGTVSLADLVFKGMLR
jgi:predicted transcriptional regulator